MHCFPKRYPFKKLKNMKTVTADTDGRFVKRYHWLGIIVICVASVPLHFLYEWLGELAVVGVFAPINESIWEHLKLVFWPLLLWWEVGYLIFQNSKSLSLTKWATAAMTSIFFSMAFIVSWYYTWLGAFAIESSIIDIGSLFIAVPIAQLLGIHVYQVVKPRKAYLILATLFFLLFAAMFIVFTFESFDFPIFIPPSG